MSGRMITKKCISLIVKRMLRNVARFLNDVIRDATYLAIYACLIVSECLCWCVLHGRMFELLSLACLTWQLLGTSQGYGEGMPP